MQAPELPDPVFDSINRASPLKWLSLGKGFFSGDVTVVDLSADGRLDRRLSIAPPPIHFSPIRRRGLPQLGMLHREFFTDASDASWRSDYDDAASRPLAAEFASREPSASAGTIRREFICW